MPERRALLRDGAVISVFENSAAMVEAAADEFAALLGPPARERTSVSIALAGGTTPAELYRELAKRSIDRDDERAAWRRVHIWFGDERCVAPEHADSNYRMAREALLDTLQLPAPQVHRIRGELAPDVAARDYAQELRNHFGDKSPHFDLVLLGIGEDGHTASLFPGTSALHERGEWVAANWVAKLGAQRITLTYPALCAAAEVWIFAAGARKAEIVAAVLDGPTDAGVYPVQGVRTNTAPVRWWLDAAAAAKLA